MIRGLLRRLGLLGRRYTVRRYSSTQYLRSRTAGAGMVRVEKHG